MGRPLIRTALVLTVLISSCALALRTTGVQQYLIKSCLEDLELHCGAHLKIKEFAWDWPCTVALRGVEVDLHGRKLMDCEVAKVTFSLSGVSPFWYVKEVALDHPFIYLEKDAGGHWLSPSPEKMKAGVEGQSFVLAAPFASPIVVRLNRGTIAAKQGGRQVLRVGDVSGQLTLPHDPGMGMHSLLTHLERLRPSPWASNLHRDDMEPGPPKDSKR